jgi:hypothetical protein
MKLFVVDWGVVNLLVGFDDLGSTDNAIAAAVDFLEHF